MKKTTGQLRTEAWDAKEQKEYKKAARLYGLAVINYPKDNPLSELDKTDRIGLRKLKREMKSMI